MALVTANVPRLPLSLDPLTGEAKRRARQRRVLLALTAVLVVGGGAAAAIAAWDSPGPDFVPTRPASSAVQASLADVHQMTRLVPGIRHVPLPYFGVLVSLRNASGESIILERVRLDLTAGSPLQQIGTRWLLFAPEVCTRQMISCPINWALVEPGTARRYAADLVSGTTRPYGAESPSPLRVPPGHTAVAQLNFFVPCTVRSRREAVLAAKSTTIVYALPNGARILQHAPPPAQHTARHFGAIVNSAGAAKAWTGALPGSPLTGAIGEVATHACHR